MADRGETMRAPGGPECLPDVTQSTVEPARPPAPGPRWRRLLVRLHIGPRTAVCLLGLLVLAIAAVLALRFCRPTKDADLWWHLAYARDMVRNGSLIPDHTAYSWTPANGDHIYCVWLSQAILYGLFRAGGLPILFAFRYLCLLLVLGLVWDTARRQRLAMHPVTYLILLLVLLMHSSGDFIKPSIFSVVLVALTLYVWMRIREGSPRSGWWCYALPVIVLFWVNCHGGWIFGAFLLVVLAVGEWMNELFLPDEALPRPLRRHLFCALILAAVAVLATPYGTAYPLHLARSLLTTSVTELRTVRDYDSIFVRSQRGFHYVQFLVIAAVMLVVLHLPRLWRRRIDWVLVLPNAAFALLYARMVRTTPYWGSVFGFTAVVLLGRLPHRWRHWRRGLGALLVVPLVLGVGGWLSGRAVREGLRRPALCQWFGFGISYINPVGEAEFIAAELPDARLGNDYNAGGYLLWRLQPERRVFIDPRYFPYRSWYAEYRALETCKGIDALLEKYPADAWCIVLPLRRTVRWFQASDQWQTVYYGPSAAVFVRTDGPYADRPLERADGLGEIRNSLQALFALDFALGEGDLGGAEDIAEGFLARFPHDPRADRVRARRQVVRGVRLVRSGEYDEALAVLGQVAEVLPDSRTVRVTRVKAMHQMMAECHRAGDLDGAIAVTRDALSLSPDNAVFLYDMAVLCWMRERRDRGAEAETDYVEGEWQDFLGRFLAAENTRAVPSRASQTAKALLLGTYRGSRPPLLLPKRPSATPRSD